MIGDLVLVFGLAVMAWRVARHRVPRRRLRADSRIGKLALPAGPIIDERDQVEVLRERARVMYAVRVKDNKVVSLARLPGDGVEIMR